MSSERFLIRSISFKGEELRRRSISNRLQLKVSWIKRNTASSLRSWTRNSTLDLMLTKSMEMRISLATNGNNCSKWQNQKRTPDQTEIRMTSSLRRTRRNSLSNPMLINLLVEEGSHLHPRRMSSLRLLRRDLRKPSKWKERDPCQLHLREESPQSKQLQSLTPRNTRMIQTVMLNKLELTKKPLSLLMSIWEQQATPWLKELLFIKTQTLRK